MIKRLLISVILLCQFSFLLHAQKALIYYEGLVNSSINHYAYEFQPRMNEVSNFLSEIIDSAFLSFLDKKIAVAKRCTKEDCYNAAYKPIAMIQVVYIKNPYCYYTLNLSSGFDFNNSLTIDGKSYIPDIELQEVIVEIVKFRLNHKHSISNDQLQDILNGKRTENLLWHHATF